MSHAGSVSTVTPPAPTQRGRPQRVETPADPFADMIPQENTRNPASAPGQSVSESSRAAGSGADTGRAPREATDGSASRTEDNAKEDRTASDATATPAGGPSAPVPVPLPQGLSAATADIAPDGDAADPSHAEAALADEAADGAASDPDGSPATALPAAPLLATAGAPAAPTADTARTLSEASLPEASLPETAGLAPAPHRPHAGPEAHEAGPSTAESGAEGTTADADSAATPAKSFADIFEQASQPDVARTSHGQPGQTGQVTQFTALTTPASQGDSAAPVPTATAAPQPAPGPAVPVAGVPFEIAARAKDGTNRFEIRLDPPELGRIDVRLEVDRHGHVTSRLMVERPETLDLLRRDAQTLERALQDSGLKTGDGSLQFSLRDQGGGQAGQNGPHHQGPGHDLRTRVLSDPDIVPPDLAGAAYGRALRGGDGIDIRV